MNGSVGFKDLKSENTVGDSLSELGSYKLLKINQVIFFAYFNTVWGPFTSDRFSSHSESQFFGALGIPTWKKGSSSIGAKKLIGWSPLDTTRYYVYVPDP